MENENLKPIEKLTPFTKMIMTIGTLPSSFYSSMTYYEAMCWLYEYLKNDVIPTVNNNAEAVEELQQKFIEFTGDINEEVGDFKEYINGKVDELETYMNNYFENLDVQQEINNKLDAMALDGTLTNLIKDYVDPIYEAYETEIDGRLDDQDEEIRNFKSSINTKVDEMEIKVDAATSGSPLAASSTSDMTETDRIYVNTTDGNWYYYDGDSWEIGGVYQGTVVDPTDPTIVDIKSDINVLENTIYANDLDIAHPTEIEKITTGSGTVVGTNGAASSRVNQSYFICNVTPGKWYNVKGTSKSTASYGLYAFYSDGSWSDYIADTVYISDNTKENWNIYVKAPANAKYIRCSNGITEDYELKVYEIPIKPYDDLPHKYVSLDKTLFLENGGIQKTTGADADLEGFIRTPYIKIDKESDIVLFHGYETASINSPLCVYDKNFNIVHDYSTGTAGSKNITILSANIPENAYYFRASGRSGYEADKYITNGILTYNRLASADHQMILDLQQENSTIKSSITSLDNRETIDNLALQYENYINNRELYLRQKYKNSGEDEHWYGATWKEEDNPNNVTGIYSTGDSSLLSELPIQNLMKRCVYKNGEVVYYLDENNSDLKADGTSATLDGTDGNVMVEIPEFFYKYEESLDENQVRTITVKLSQQGLDGFNYHPKEYVSAYEATVDHQNNVLASVCTATFTRATEEVTITSENNYIEGNGYSLGTQKTAVRSGFTANATRYRGATNDSSFDTYTDPTNENFCRNQLGLPYSRTNRTKCRNLANIYKGELMYQYNAQKAIWMLSIVEYRNRDIRAALGKGATVYPSYEAYEYFFIDSHQVGVGGLAVIPCGVTNSLGNKSGQVYYYMPTVPVTASEASTSATFTFDNVWMPCVSYRGIEHFYGHLYKIADQITVKSQKTNTDNPDIPAKKLYNVKYYYQRNPFKTNDKLLEDELIWSGQFTPNINPNKKLLFGFDGHILPILTAASDFTKNYTDCAEFGNDVEAYISFNGRIVSNDLVGRDFIVAMYGFEYPGRANDGTRIVAYNKIN